MVEITFSLEPFLVPGRMISFNATNESAHEVRRLKTVVDSIAKYQNLPPTKMTAKKNAELTQLLAEKANSWVSSAFFSRSFLLAANSGILQYCPRPFSTSSLRVHSRWWH
jgi:hypothetical protein